MQKRLLNQALFSNFAKNKAVKKIFLILLFTFFFIGCHSNKTTLKETNPDVKNSIKNDTLRIANNELEYEILIIEPGFEAWLTQQPPMGHYGINYLENKNRLWVLSYNDKVYKDVSRKLYEQEINYDSTIHYGLEVNYLLFNYFKFFQQKYKQKL